MYMYSNLNESSPLIGMPYFIHTQSQLTKE